MPLFKNVRTGVEKVADDDYVSAFPAGTWERLADEAPSEKRARQLREQEEAIRNKVELEADDDDSPEAVQHNAPPELGVIHHDNENQEG